MVKLQNVVFFLAGMELYHTFLDLILYMLAPLPLDLKFLVLTPEHFYWAIPIHAMITVALLIVAVRMGKKQDQVARVHNKMPSLEPQVNPMDA